MISDVKKDFGYGIRCDDGGIFFDNPTTNMYWYYFRDLKPE